ncbi:hypothetical protein [Geopsychrobacter electrodiphilus]|uniref:hypothetical protein n=1 Tax=Geopsychrobacter electrodiphilus TaxID=225196 RepID=UPI000361FB51|nr:hypothetical protein [Geopsychrobacter electrodiphilus]
MQTVQHKREGFSDQLADRVQLSWRLFSTVTRSFSNSRFLLHATGKLRRFFLVHFRKSYVQNQLSTRQGKCRQCGTCCNLLFTCPSLTNDGNCIVYGICRPQACKVFPIDPRDVAEAEACGTRCGYDFSSRDLNPMAVTQKD